MTKLASYIYQWYVVFLLVLGYTSESISAEFQGVKVIISGGTLNPYLESLQVSAILPLSFRKRERACSTYSTYVNFKLCHFLHRNYL
jgi:hypothetical protein